jgi:malonate transporter
MPLDHPIVSAMLPVVAVVAIGWLAARRGLVSREAGAGLAELVFYVLGPALLFRGTSRVDLTALEAAPLIRYYAVAVGLYAALVVAYGRDVRAAVLALAGVFSNVLMVGMPVVGLAFGEAGLTILFSVVATHALVLLGVATFVLEMARARERSAAGETGGSPWRTVGRSLRGTLLHPVPLPILAGLAFGATGLPLPAAVDHTVALLASAFAPLALLLVGSSLAHARTAGHRTTAVQLAMVKTLVHPLLMAAVGWATGLEGLPLAVAIVTAALPIGANAFLFARITRHEEATVITATAVSTVIGLVGVAVALALTRGLVATGP